MRQIMTPKKRDKLIVVGSLQILTHSETNIFSLHSHSLFHTTFIIVFDKRTVIEIHLL